MNNVYYNEIDPFCVEWLRALMGRGVIPTGTIDNRSIEDVKPIELKEYDQCHFFAGIGVWAYALEQAGWGDAPVWTGSCPCQPFSAAGKGKGTTDERHLWPAFFHLIRNVRPVTVFGEQVASKAGLAWLDLVQADLEGEGYANGAVDTCAAGFGAPHIRQRLYWVAHTELHGYASTQNGGSSCTRQDEGRLLEPARACASNGFWSNVEWLHCADGKARAVEPGTFPLAHGATNRVGRLRGYGNAIVAPQAIEFVKAYMEMPK